MANRLHSLHRLPYRCIENVELCGLYQLYGETFEQLLDIGPEISTLEQEEEFSKLLLSLLDNRTDRRVVVPLMVVTALEPNNEKAATPLGCWG